MARVDFYVLADSSPQSMHQFVCKLAEKAWIQGHRIFIHTDSSEQSSFLDDMLWTFKDGSFIPHAIAGNDDGSEQPILISDKVLTCDDFELMINLSTQTAFVDNNCVRIAEIVNQQAERKRSGREHYKLYRDQGFELHHHQIGHP